MKSKKRWVEIVKNVSGRKWNLEKICWELPYTKDTLKQLWELIGKKNIALNFKIDVNIPKEYNYKYTYSPRQKTKEKKFKLK